MLKSRKASQSEYIITERLSEYLRKRNFACRRKEIRRDEIISNIIFIHDRCGALEKGVTQQTKASNYLIFSVFEMDGERYVGIWGHFFGKASTEQAAKTLEGLLEKAREGVGEKK